MSQCQWTSWESPSSSFQNPVTLLIAASNSIYRKETEISFDAHQNVSSNNVGDFIAIHLAQVRKTDSWKMHGGCKGKQARRSEENVFDERGREGSTFDACGHQLREKRPNTLRCLFTRLRWLATFYINFSNHESFFTESRVCTFPFIQTK